MPREVLSKDGICYGCDYCKAYFEHRADAQEHEERYHSDKELHTAPMPKYFIGELIGFEGRMYIIRDIESCPNTNMNLYSISVYRDFCTGTNDPECPFIFSKKVIKVYEYCITGRINKGKLLETTRRLLKVCEFMHAKVEVMAGYGGTALTELLPVINLGLGNE